MSDSMRGSNESDGSRKRQFEEIAKQTNYAFPPVNKLAGVGSPQKAKPKYAAGINEFGSYAQGLSIAKSIVGAFETLASNDQLVREEIVVMHGGDAVLSRGNVRDILGGAQRARQELATVRVLLIAAREENARGDEENARGDEENARLRVDRDRLRLKLRAIRAAADAA